MRIRRQHSLRVYRLGTDDSITVPLHPRWLRRLGFQGAVTFHLAEIRRAPKGARRDRDHAIVQVHRH